MKEYNDIQDFFSIDIKQVVFVHFQFVQKSEALVKLNIRILFNKIIEILLFLGYLEKSVLGADLFFPYNGRLTKQI